MSKQNNNNNVERNLVIRYEILKSQTELEEKSKKLWPEKWGFYLDFDKIVIKEAAKRGINEVEYRRRTVKKKPNKEFTEAQINFKIIPSNVVPKTTTGFIGWRASKDYSLEKCEALYKSPKATLFKDPEYSCIFLG